MQRVGILDHTSSSIGGAQYVNACMAECLSTDYAVELIHGGQGYQLGDLVRVFSVDLTKTTERVLGGLTDADGFGVPGRRSVVAQLHRSRMLTAPYDLFIYSGLNLPPFCFADAGLAYIHFPIEERYNFSTQRCYGSGGLTNGIKRVAYPLLGRYQTHKYGSVIGNSAFTAEWIRRRWELPAQVIYPPVSSDFLPSDKGNSIVSLGRFTAGRQTKGQLEQIAAFREFCNRVGEGWTLCMVGFCTDRSDDKAYLRKVQEAASGLPVTFLIGADRSCMSRCITAAKLFWHTSGLSIDEEQQPESAEHFGIATVEAMKAGCVPVVVASGGQREIIENERSGFLAANLPELIEASIRLATNEPMRQRAAVEAVRRSSVFSKESFQRQIFECVSQRLARIR